MYKEQIEFNGEIVIATGNKGKLQEIQDLLQSTGIKCRLPGKKFDVDETGETYEDNAALKAVAVSKTEHTFSVGEDSGLEIEGLEGWPGIYSARFIDGTDEDKCKHILKKLDGISNRRAKFVAAIAFSGPEGVRYVTRSEFCGTIANVMRGDSGFGYDPIFIPENSVRTLAEMDMSEKNTISHRYKVFKKLSEYLKGLMQR